MQKNVFSQAIGGATAVSAKSPKIIFQKRHVVFLLVALMSLCPMKRVSAGMAEEHQALLNLLPLKNVDREVVNSGSWSNPATWSGGHLPKAGENLYVPEGKALLVDIVSDDSLNTLRVDGDIKFDTTKSVRIKLDTLLVTSTGTFEIGSEGRRLPKANKVEIIITTKGEIDRSWDPLVISRGVILQGGVRIFGAEKSAFHALSSKPDSGTTQIQLDSVPTGWMKGDIIAVTAARFAAANRYIKNDPFRTEDELRRINAISGTTITLGSVSDPNTLEPLVYSHVPTITEMPVYAANLTRNIEFSSEGGQSVPADQRGHFMVVHTPDVVIKGASFNYLGRTDKSKAIDDFKLNPNGSRIRVNGQLVPGANTNVRGRYAVHFHHTGVTDLSIAPVICSGNAILSSVGWGFVNHGSNVNMENNASYDVFGSHYVSEDGNELGTFKHNIAIRAKGSRVALTGGEFNHDGGRSGHGFWLESRNMTVEDNVVSGVFSAGIIYFQRNFMTNPADLEIPKENLLTADKEIVKELPTINYKDIPITSDKNNTILSSGSALRVIKDGRLQRHDVRNMIDSLKGYSVLTGVALSYTERYTFRDLHLVASPATTDVEAGVHIGRVDRDMAFVNANVDGFVHPFVTGDTFQKKPDETEVVFVNVSVNGRPINLASDLQKGLRKAGSSYNPNIHHILNLKDTTNTSVLKFTPSSDTPVDLPKAYTFYIRGTKTDSLGHFPYWSRWDQPSIQKIYRKGYYTLKDGSKAIKLTDVYTDRLNGQTRTFDTVFRVTPSPYQSLGANLGILSK